jgi:hypothetical protein
MKVPSLSTLAFPHWKLAALGVYGLVMFGAGHKVCSWQHDHAQVKVLKKQAKAVEHKDHLEGATQAISQVSRDEGDAKQASIRTVYKTIQEKVPYYVPTQASEPTGTGPAGVAGVHPYGPSLPLGAVRLHDYAALGVDPPVPAPSGEPLGAPSGVELPAFVGTVAGNYGVCQGWRAEAVTWREWYARELAAWGTVK